MDILEIYTVIIKYLLLNSKNTEDLCNGFISKEQSKFNISLLKLSMCLGYYKNVFSP